MQRRYRLGYPQNGYLEIKIFWYFLAEENPPTNAEWSCWSEWSLCTLTCGGQGQRSRQRACIPGTENVGSQNIICQGEGVEVDQSCAYSSVSCPVHHCPYGYQFGSSIR